MVGRLPEDGGAEEEQVVDVVAPGGPAASQLPSPGCGGDPLKAIASGWRSNRTGML